MALAARMEAAEIPLPTFSHRRSTRDLRVVCGPFLGAAATSKKISQSVAYSISPSPSPPGGEGSSCDSLSARKEHRAQAAHMSNVLEELLLRGKAFCEKTSNSLLNRFQGLQKI